MADAARAVQHLALEVRDVDDVEVDEPERSHAGGGKIQRGRRAEATRADEQNARRLDALLTVEPDVGKDEMPAVAKQLFARQIHSENVARRAARGRSTRLTVPRSLAYVVESTD